MDKYEFNIKVEQIKKLVNRGDYATAMKIADTIDWRRVRNSGLLSMVSQIYEKNEEYQEAKEILLIAYERSPVGKRILYKLTDLALRDGSVGEAESFYREFCELAQDDPRQYLLRYLILKTKNAPMEQLIRALEMYTSTELDEKWMYELAELYHKSGLEDKCVATCDTIMLMFGLGKYVDKAMDLKLEYAPLNKYQMDLVENRDKYDAKLRAVEEEYGGKTYIEPDEEDALEQDDAEADVIRIHEDAEAEKLAREMAKITDEPQTASIEEDEMGSTRALNDLHSIKEIKPTQRVLDAAAERKEAEDSETAQEIERQRTAIRAAKAREEMEEEALRRVEEEREIARREEAERRARREAEIARERAQKEEAERLARLEQERLEREKATIEEEHEEHEAEVPADETYHLMIEAETEEEGLSMAIEALKKIHRELGYKNPVAKIGSEKLNVKGIRSIAGKLAGKDLIIERAAGLTSAVQNQLDDLMENDDTGMIVVLIDTPENLENLHGTHASLASKFQYIGVDPESVKVKETEAALEKVLLKETTAQEKIAKETVKTAQMEKTPVKVASVKAEPVESTPIEVTPVKAEPVKAEPVKVTPVKVEPVKVAPPKAEPVKAVSVEVAPVETVPVEVVPAEAEPVKAAQMEIMEQSEPEVYDYEADMKARARYESGEELEEEEEFEPAVSEYAAVREAKPAEESEYIDAPETAREEEESFESEEESGEESERDQEEDSDDDEDAAEAEVTQYNEDSEYDDEIEMTTDEFAQFAGKYASEIDCSITGKSMLALYERIEMMEEDGVRLTKKAAVDLIEEAADKAEKQTLGRRITSIFSPAYDKEGYLILREKDFFD